MKVTPCTMEVAFVDPFPRDLESLFLEKDAVSTVFTIEDQDTVKHESAMMEDTKWPALFNLGCQAEVTMDPFPRDLESLFLEKDAVSTAFTIEDKDTVTVKHGSASTEDNKWPVLVNLGIRAEVSANPVGTMVTIQDSISIFDLGGKAVDSSTTTVCRQDNLSKKPLQEKHREIGLNSSYRSIYDFYDPGSEKDFHIHHAHNNQTVRKLQYKQRPEDPGGILSLNHRAGVRGVKVLQPGMRTAPAVIGGYGGGRPGARALILRSK